MRPNPGYTRRGFIGSIATSPALGLLSVSASASGTPPGGQVELDPEKFSPIDLSRYYSATSSDFKLTNQPAEITIESLRTPAGLIRLKGIPLLFGDRHTGGRDWLAISKANRPDTRSEVEIAIGRRAAFVCLAQFTDWPSERGDKPNPDLFEPVGEMIATAILAYRAGGEETFPIRRRFEVNTPVIPWGHFCFTAAPGTDADPMSLDAPLVQGTDWGGLQMGFTDNVYRPPILWLYPLRNPHPARIIETVKLLAAGQSTLVVCGLTLCHKPQHPFRYERLSTYRLTLPEQFAADLKRWKIQIDLGVIARQHVLPAFNADAWLDSSWAGLGSSANAALPDTRFRYLEIAASAAATLSVTDSQTQTVYKFDLADLDPDSHIEAKSGEGRIEILDKHKVWIHGRILDAASGRPIPARLSLRSREGRYIPPSGHRSEINTGWFQDYGADLKVGASSFAYVDGTFEAELPVGDVYVEISKGFEYQPLRKRLRITPQIRSLDLILERWIDLRSRGWITADTHVHFLSPSTALLESQAEGVNLVNLMAAQLGDLFANVGDLPGGSLRSSDHEYLVWLGTENRQHVLGHISLMHGQGSPVFPLSSGGPSTSYFGDPVHYSLAEWADACRQREGLVISPHFPDPPGEIAADIVTGRIDAVELWPRGVGFGFPFQEWYRYLNCGYRLPAVGGTDKMSARVPVGANRTYAYLGNQEFNFEYWSHAVRSGNTFCSTGPLLFFQVEGKPPGTEILLGADGGTLEILAEARSGYPVHKVEVVCNGRVVASAEDAVGKPAMILRENLKIAGPAWLAARCWSITPSTAAWPFSLAAHTSPVYLTVPGRELFSAPTAAYLLRLIEGAEAWTAELATRADEERRKGILKVFGTARETLQKRIMGRP